MQHVAATITEIQNGFCNKSISNYIVNTVQRSFCSLLKSRPHCIVLSIIKIIQKLRINIKKAMPELLTDSSSFQNAIKNGSLTVVHFSADWVEQCAQIDEVLDALSKQPDYSNAKFCKCLAEDLSEISLKYKIEAVPTVLIFKSGNVLDRIDGVDAAKITSKVKQHYVNSNNSSNNPSSVPQNNENVVPLDERLKKLINKHNVMLFMKGDRNNPRCGFSKQTVHILNETGVEYGTFDILTDEDVRQGLKTYSDWPTYPQLYVKGELIGGLDIIKEMQSAGELLSTLNA